MFIARRHPQMACALIVALLLCPISETPCRAEEGTQGVPESEQQQPAKPPSPPPGRVRRPQAIPSKVTEKPVISKNTMEPFELPDMSVPLPSVADQGDKIIKLNAKSIDVRDFLETLSDTSGWTIISTPQVKGQITGWLKNIAPADCLKILAVNDLYYEKEGNILTVMTREEYLHRRYGVMTTRDFQVQHVDVETLVQSVSPFLSKEGRILADPRTNKLVVVDTAAHADYIAAVIEGLDTTREHKPLVKSEFPIKYANSEQLTEALQPILTGSGRIVSDPRTNKIIVFDSEKNMEIIADVVKGLDIEVAYKAFKLSYANPEDIRDRLETIVGKDNGQVEIDERTNTIYVYANPEKMAFIESMMPIWDKKSKQVLIEADILEVSSGKLKELGINFDFAHLEGGAGIYLDPETGVYGTRPGQYVSTYGVALPAISGEAAALSILLNKVWDIADFRATINALAEDSSTKVLARPRIMVMDGNKARFEVSTLEPYPDMEFDAEGNFKGLNIQFIDVGTILEVTPRINDDGNILMEIVPEVSDVLRRETFETVIGVGGGDGDTITPTITVPVETKSSAATNVLIKDGETIVIGGLKTGRKEDIVRKVPILGDIPLLGIPFRNIHRDKDERELMIFITPHIVSGEKTSAEVRTLQEFNEIFKFEDQKDAEEVEDDSEG